MTRPCKTTRSCCLESPSAGSATKVSSVASTVPLGQAHLALPASQGASAQLLHRCPSKQTSLMGLI